jgi:hypothetical protein
VDVKLTLEQQAAASDKPNSRIPAQKEKEKIPLVEVQYITTGTCIKQKL